VKIWGAIILRPVVPVVINEPGTRALKQLVGGHMREPAGVLAGPEAKRPVVHTRELVDTVTDGRVDVKWEHFRLLKRKCRHQHNENAVTGAHIGTGYRLIPRYVQISRP